MGAPGEALALDRWLALAAVAVLAAVWAPMDLPLAAVVVVAVADGDLATAAAVADRREALQQQVEQELVEMGAVGGRE